MNVLIAVDDQKCSDAVISYAVANASMSKADIRVISVVPGAIAYTSLAMIPDMMQELRSEATHNAERVVVSASNLLRAALPEAKVSEYIIEGLPADEILAMAKDWDADLIVVGSHGRHGFNKILLGSVSQAVVSNPPCSVLVVNLSRAQKVYASVAGNSCLTSDVNAEFFKAGVTLGN